MDNKIKIGIAAFGTILTLIITSLFLQIAKIEGNQLGVKETWGEGVLPEPLPPKTYILFPAFLYTIHKYDMGVQVYAMNNQDGAEEFAEGRKSDAYVVQSKDQQDMTISLRIQWRRLPNTLVDLHKNARNEVEERVIRPALLNIVKNQATLLTALEAYSGEGLVKLQLDILKKLQESEELGRFIKVENFVIESIGLDSAYVEQIKAKQVAVQEKLRADEETKAAFAKAEKAKAVAQADYEKTIVEARRDKEKGILEAEKKAQQQVLAAEAEAKQVALQAEAEKNRNVLIAEGEKEAATNRAQAIIALGTAEAESQKLKLSAYAVEGSDAFVRIEVARSMSDAFKNISGYLPEGMTVNLLSESYDKGVSLLVGDKNAE